MCEPTTIAAVMPYLYAAGAATAAYGVYQSSEASKDAAKYQAAVNENNAKVADYQAQDAIRRGDEEANRIARQANLMKGQQRAAQAASGLELTEGTAAELQGQTDFFSLIDQSTAKDNAQREAWGIRRQGTGFRDEASMQRAKAASTNTGLAVASSLLGSSGKVADSWYTSQGRW